jgi:hypothetical protein
VGDSWFSYNCSVFAYLLIALFGAINLVRRYLHLFIGKPVAGFDGQVTNCPDLVVRPELRDEASRPVATLMCLFSQDLLPPLANGGPV